MKTFLSLTVCTLMCITSLFAQGKLIVKKGQKRTITKKETAMIVKEWVMEDSSSIVFEEGVLAWTISADKVKLGKGVSITGKGVNGTDGGNGNNGEQRRIDCEPGKSGTDGTKATNGTNGVSITMTIGIVSIVDANIDVSGGDGGNGGNGGHGSHGTKGDCSDTCHGGNGGNGGDGGDGGIAGKGGDVIINYRFVKDAMLGENLLNSDGTGLKVVNQGGSGGYGGLGGNLGRGGRKVKCPIAQRSRNKGSSGTRGQDGRSLPDGADGITLFNLY